MANPLLLWILLLVAATHPSSVAGEENPCLFTESDQPWNEPEVVTTGVTYTERDPVQVLLVAKANLSFTCLSDVRLVHLHDGRETVTGGLQWGPGTGRRELVAHASLMVPPGGSPHTFWFKAEMGRANGKEEEQSKMSLVSPAVEARVISCYGKKAEFDYRSPPPNVEQVDMSHVRVDWAGLVRNELCLSYYILEYWPSGEGKDGGYKEVSTPTAGTFSMVLNVPSEVPYNIRVVAVKEEDRWTQTYLSSALTGFTTTPEGGCGPREKYPRSILPNVTRLTGGGGGECAGEEAASTYRLDWAGAVTHGVRQDCIDGFMVTFFEQKEGYQEVEVPKGRTSHEVVAKCCSQCNFRVFPHLPAFVKWHDYT